MNILLVCPTGIQSLVLANKVKDSAHINNRNYTIDTAGQLDVSDKIRNSNLIVMFPQMKHILHKIVPQAKKYNVPIETISKDTYFSSNGHKILEVIDNALSKD